MVRAAPKRLKSSGAAHYHLWNLPKSIYPRRRGNKAKEYAQDFFRVFQSLQHTHRKVQHAATIAAFCIKSAGQKKQDYVPQKHETFEAVQEFVYHYENFCYRVYVLREKLIRFVNEVIPVGFKDNEVVFKHILIQPVLRQAGILKEIQRFTAPRVLGKIIEDRNALTHRLYFYYANVDHHLRPTVPAGKKLVVDKKWFKSWQTQIESRAMHANKGMNAIWDLTHGISDKIVKLKS